MATSEPAAATDLAAYIAVAKAGGMADDALVALLKGHGWSERRVYAGFLWAFLRGALTARFLLDTLVLLTIGGGIFAYYLAGLRSPQPET